MKLDGYIRVSRKNGREGDSYISPSQQRDKIETWAKLRGAEIVKWHKDEDQSGGKLSRPEFDNALERVAAGTTNGIVVAKLDRFSRAGVADALKLIESIIEAGGEVASVEEGIDPTTPTGEFTMTLFLALARMQRQQIGATWSDSRRRAVARRIHVTGRPPTGYDRDEDGRLVPNAAAPHIAEVFRMRAAGTSLRELAEYLRAHEVESSSGMCQWRARSVTLMLRNRAYLGEARSGEFVQAGAHEAIVDEGTWLAVQRARKVRAPSRGGGLLSGILVCGGCGGTLKADTMTDHKGQLLRNYRCRRKHDTGEACPGPATVLARIVEPYVVQEFLAWLGTEAAAGPVQTAEREASEQAVERAERELTGYLGAVSVEDVGAEAFAAGARQRREAVDQAHRLLERLREQDGSAELPSRAELEREWPELTVVERRSILRGGLDAVVLRRSANGGRSPIEDRVLPVWRER